MTVREVIITRPFWQAFEAQADYFESVSHQFPDAGRRLERLAEDLIDRVIPLLEHSADIGRLYGLAAGGPHIAKSELSTIEEGLSLVNATLREYVDSQFNILYAVTLTQVFFDQFSQPEAGRVLKRVAKLIGVNLRTLQNWEQLRTRPTGPARALLKIVESNPKTIEALHT